MSEKTMRKWFKTFLMLLPFLFLAIFAVAVRKDGLKYEVEQPPYEIYDVEYQYEELSISEDEFIVPVEDMIDEYDYWYLNFDAFDFFNTSEGNEGYIVLGEFNTHYNTILRLNRNNYELEFSQDGTIEQEFSSMLSQSLDEYVNAFYLEDILYTDIETIIGEGTESLGLANEVQLVIYIEYSPKPSFQNTPLTFNFDNADILPKNLKDRSQEPSYIEGPQAVLLHFNDMIDENFNINAFGLNQFYDWINENWFNNEAPLIVKPIFNLLVYEAIIEIIFLMFSFITFIIRFAQQWIDGIYSKGGKK